MRRCEHAGEGIDEEGQLRVVDEGLLFQSEFAHRLQALRLQPGPVAGDLTGAIGDASQVAESGSRAGCFEDGVPQPVILVNMSL